MTDFVIKILNYGVCIGFAVALVALPFFLVQMIRYSNRSRINKAEQMPIKTIAFFAGSIFLVFIFSSIISALVGNKVLSFLGALPSNHSVFVNGNAATKPQEVIAALQNMHPVMAHHSHPTREIKVKITTKDTNMILTLQRDSDRPQEYWVFFQQPPLSSGYELGRITTGVFDSF